MRQIIACDFIKIRPFNSILLYIPMPNLKIALVHYSIGHSDLMLELELIRLGCCCIQELLLAEVI